MSFKSIQRSKKYGIAFSICESGKTFSSTKWLLARWYVHGSIPIKFNTVFHNQEGITISKNYIVFFSNPFKINMFLKFNPKLNIVKFNLLYLNKLFKFFCLKSSLSS